MHIRLARLSDSAGLAKVQVDSYQMAYAGLLPDAFLKQFTYEEQTQDWIDLLSQEKPNPLYVAVSDEDQVIGYALGCIPKDKKFDCELSALHVYKAYQRQGYGAALMSAVARHYTDAGYMSIMLWTLKHNPARALYEKLGGELVGEKTDLWEDGTQVTEVAYGWSSIRALIQSDVL